MLKVGSVWLFVLALICRVASAQSLAAHEFTLTNGLKLIVQEDHRAPVVVTQVWYRVGSSYEHDGITGISHMLEHMMFQGTSTVPPGEFSRIISRNGGRENAFTGRDYTAYFEQLAKSRLAVSFELESDRMSDLVLSKEEFLKEQQVVIEERRLRTVDDPQALAFEKAMAVAFQTSPYRQPVIGWMADIERLTVEGLRGWYEKWYAPANAIVVVVGDVDPQEVFALAKRYFGPLPAGTVAKVPHRPEVPQTGEKRVIVREPAKVPYLVMGYKVPSLKSAMSQPDKALRQEAYALEVLAGLLDGGDSARLTKHLVRDKQIAADASAGYELLARLETLFLLSAIPAPGYDVKALESALQEEIERVKTQPIPLSELERVKTQVITADTYERDSMFYQAMQIGMLETIGLDWTLKERYVDNVKAVTAKEVQAVARKYLVSERVTVAVLEPLPASDEREQL